MINPFTLAARRLAAKPVESAITEFEFSLNTSLSQAGAVLTAIGNARKDRRSQMDLTVGMEASENLAQAVGALASSYRHTVGAHFHLARDKAVLGLGNEPKAWGDLRPTFAALDEEQMAAAAGRLGIVAAKTSPEILRATG